MKSRPVWIHWHTSTTTSSSPTTTASSIITRWPEIWLSRLILMLWVGVQHASGGRKSDGSLLIRVLNLIWMMNLLTRRRRIVWLLLHELRLLVLEALWWPLSNLRSRICTSIDCLNTQIITKNKPNKCLDFSGQ